MPEALGLFWDRTIPRIWSALRNPSPDNPESRIGTLPLFTAGATLSAPDAPRAEWIDTLWPTNGNSSPQITEKYCIHGTEPHNSYEGERFMAYQAKRLGEN